MTNEPNSGENQIFRPSSMKDFKDYAKNLAWMLEEPLQATQGLLARIYGYSGLHELQQVMRQPAHDEHSQPRIFYDTNRALDLIAEQKGVDDYKDLTWRDFAAAQDIELFAPPPIHYREFRRTKLKFEIHEGGGADGTELPASAYATVDYRSYDNEAFLAFTQLGKALYDLASDLLDRIDHLPEDRAREQIDEVFGLINRYPTHPWLRAILIGKLIEWQDWNWGESWHRYTSRFDDGASSEEPTHQFIDECEITVRLFEEIYEGQGHLAPIHALVTGSYDHGADCWYWPNVLAWQVQGLLRLNEEERAWTVLKKYYAVIGSPYPHLKVKAAMMMLGRSDKRLLSLYDDEAQAYFPSEHVTYAVGAIAEGDLKRGVDHLTLGLTGNPGYVNLLGKNDDDPYWSDADAFDPDEDGYSEFVRWTSPFWNNNPTIRDFFRSLCNASTARLANSAHKHEREIQEWGLDDLELYDDEAESVKELRIHLHTLAAKYWESINDE